jgi:acyl carrier protein
MGLDSVEIIMVVEDRFGIEITDTEAARCIRVGDLKVGRGSRV